MASAARWILYISSFCLFMKSISCQLNPALSGGPRPLDFLPHHLPLDSQSVTNRKSFVILYLLGILIAKEAVS